MKIATSAAPATGTSFDKGLAVLGHILDHDAVRVDAIAEALGLPVSSVYRFLRSLKAADFVMEDDGRYRAGPRLSALGGGGAAHGGSISAIAAPFLEHLAAATGETAVLTVRRGLHAVCVQQVESAHQIKLAFQLGQLLPLYAGAGQRALLAFAPDEVQRQVIDGVHRGYTVNTPTATGLRRQLAQIRAEGEAVSRGELIDGSFAIAMPVLAGGVAVAGLCIAGPRHRCDAAWQARARQELGAAVESMSASMARPVATSTAVSAV